MARQFSIDLDERSWHFIEQQLATGRYGSIDDVVQEGLQLLEDHQARLEAPREALIIGENSGVAGPFDLDAFLAEKRAERQKRQDDGRS